MEALILIQTIMITVNTVVVMVISYSTLKVVAQLEKRTER